MAKTRILYKAIKMMVDLKLSQKNYFGYFEENY